jgi:hypothetical protein
LIEPIFERLAAYSQGDEDWLASMHRERAEFARASRELLA